MRHHGPRSSATTIGKGPYSSEWEYVENELATRRCGMDGPVTHKDLLESAQAESKVLAQKTTAVAGFKGGAA